MTVWAELARQQTENAELRAEIERLRSTTEISPVHVRELQADNARMRSALQQIADLHYDYNCAPIDIARLALEPRP